MLQTEKLISLEKSLEQVMEALDSYYSYCLKQGIINKAIPVRSIILEINSLLNKIKLFRNATENIPSYIADNFAKQIEDLVEKLNSREVKPLFTPEQLSELITYSTLLN